MINRGKMTFEQKQIAREAATEFDRLVSEKLVELGDASPENMVTALEHADKIMNPDHGDLTYEMDEEA